MYWSQTILLYRPLYILQSSFPSLPLYVSCSFTVVCNFYPQCVKLLSSTAPTDIMGKMMLLARHCLYFGMFLYFPIVASQTVQGLVRGEVKIVCHVAGTFTLPQWIKDGTTLTLQGVANVNPAFTRLAYDTDNKTLVVSSAQVEDSGTYECTHTAGTNSPQNTIVVIKEAPTTMTTTAPTTAGPTYNDEPLLTHDEKVIVIVVSCIIGVILILAAVIGIAANAQRKRIKHRRSWRTSHGDRRGHSMYHQDHLSERDLYDQDIIVYPHSTHQFGMPNRPYINQYNDEDDIYNRYQEVYHPYKEYYHPYDRKSEPPHVHGSRNSHVTREQMRKPQGHRDRHERRETHGLYPYTSFNRTYTQSSGELFYYGFSHNQSTHK